MNLQQEKAQLLKRLAEIGQIEAQAKSTIAETAKKLGYADPRQMLASMGSAPDTAKPSKAAPAPRKRRPNLTDAEKKAIIQAYKSRKEGETAKTIATRYKVAENTVFKLAGGTK